MNFSLIEKHIQPTHVIDVGANVGSFYRQALEVWPDAKYWLIEGNYGCEPQLQSVLRPGDNLDIAVLSDREKEVTFYLMPGQPTATGASYYREKTPFYENAIETTRRTTTLDHLSYQTEFARAPALLIKTDCQGADLDILQGAESLLKIAKAVICEVSFSEYNEGATNTLPNVSVFMAKRGFLFVEELEKIIHPIEREKIIQSDMLYLKIKTYGG